MPRRAACVCRILPAIRCRFRFNPAVDVLTFSLLLGDVGEMGLSLTRIWSHLAGGPQMRVVMVGLDAAGKTTILHKLKLGEVVQTIPTIGWNVEEVANKNMSFVAWTVGGEEDTVRRGWAIRGPSSYFRNANALIFVLDSSDRDRVEKARAALDTMLREDELRDAVLLVFANKQDLPNAMVVAEATEKLCLADIRDRPWFIQGAYATTGEGLREGLDRLASTLSSRK
eukprot:TRINITY_DN19738_c0_g1_i1.p1 TRINITY_DN19738_c0_g1~~TRINITY_DN19738_c0_g1_i1.p1  ORF type:complete len:240 (+),score=38.71 TRINITY_DN19738_c0_g1_i1:42-722(+)